MLIVGVNSRCCALGFRSLGVRIPSCNELDLGSSFRLSEETFELTFNRARVLLKLAVLLKLQKAFKSPGLRAHGKVNDE